MQHSVVFNENTFELYRLTFVTRFNTKVREPIIDAEKEKKEQSRGKQMLVE